MRGRPPPGSFVDADLLRRLKERDAALLESVFRETNPYLTRFCLANGIRGDEVPELVHRAWDQFFANLDRFEGRSRLRTFLCGILLNKIREFRRERKRFVPAEEAQPFLDEAFTPDGWWKADPPGPHRLAESRELAALARECLEGLSEQQRAAFVLKEVEEEDSGSVCNALGLTLSHLRVLLFRAKDKLRRCLEGKVGAEVSG